MATNLRREGGREGRGTHDDDLQLVRMRLLPQLPAESCRCSRKPTSMVPGGAPMAWHSVVALSGMLQRLSMRRQKQQHTQCKKIS
jgi:hypothetical protein